MDLAKFNVAGAAGAGSDLHLKNPFTGDLIYCKDGKTPFTIRVLGRDAKSVQDAVKESNRLLTEGAIDQDEQNIRAVASCVVGWSDEMAFQGKPLPYSPENCLKLLKAEETAWIGEQIIPFSMRRRNFVSNISND
jgi:hypothetical protein